MEIADVGGRGGTDFLAIENARRSARDYAFLTGFGQSAAACLLDAGVAGAATGVEPARPATVLASGGVRNPLDVAKALSLGASAVGVAGVFLDAILEGGENALSDVIKRWQSQLRELCGLLGASDIAGLREVDVLVRGRLREHCELRGVDATALARRSG